MYGINWYDQENMSNNNNKPFIPSFGDRLTKRICPKIQNINHEKIKEKKKKNWQFSPLNTKKKKRMEIKTKI